MAQIFPFKGIRYAADAIGDLAAVMTQPYDKITPEMQQAYYDRHDNNVVRIVKGRASDQDSETDNAYSRANKALLSWLAEGSLVQDERPTIYFYQTVFTPPGFDRPQTRNGFIALAGLQDFSEGGVKPHERTFDGPKADRLRLMQATGSNTECIFMLYADPTRVAGSIMDECVREQAPVIDVADEDGYQHRIWPLTDPAKIGAITEALADKELFIADGHHRYETAVNYMKEMQAAGRVCEGAESFSNCMMTFVNMEENLTILPTHRVIGHLDRFDAPATVARLEELFAIESFPFAGPSDEPGARRRMKEALAQQAGRTALGFAAHGHNAYGLLTLKPEIDPVALIDGSNSDAWKKLDVVVLHAMVLDGLLGVKADSHDEGSGVWFERDADLALDQVHDGSRQMMFLLNPTPIEAVRQIAGSGEKMPQKSTDFYPKLLSGLVLNKMNFV